MTLSDRLRTRSADRPGFGDEPAGDVQPAQRVDEAPSSAALVDPFMKLKQRAQETLFARLGARLYDASTPEPQLHAYVIQELGDILAAEQLPLTPDERAQLVTEISDDVLGHGPIEVFLADDEVTEVMVNGTQSIFVEREGRLHATEARFLSETHLRRVIERIVSAVGRRIDESSPMVDARLHDGSRVNAVIPPLSVDGPMLTIRKFRKESFTPADLVANDTISTLAADFLDAAVRGRLSVLISGGTGTGKTTFLNALSSSIPRDERIITIEDAVELRLQQPHVIRLESRPPNIEGRGEVPIRELVRNSLRMRPDRIVVGEVRGGEALDMLQAMNTGHEGSLSTLHANTPRDALNRLETMVLMAGMDLPVRAIREQVASALDLIVHVARLNDGTRRVTKIVEVVGLEGDVITMSDLFTFDWEAGLDESNRYLGTLVPTGIRPRATDKLRALGIELPGQLFGATANAESVMGSGVYR